MKPVFIALFLVALIAQVQAQNYTLEDLKKHDPNIELFEKMNSDINVMRAYAEQENVIAMYLLGIKYAAGEDINKSLPDSIKWLERAAHNNHLDAQLELGFTYRYEKEVQNDKLAFFWFNKAAENESNDSRKGDPFAQLELAYMYANGIGTDKYINKAKYWLERANKQGLNPPTTLADLIKK